MGQLIRCWFIDVDRFHYDPFSTWTQQQQNGRNSELSIVLHSVGPVVPDFCFGRHNSSDSPQRYFACGLVAGFVPRPGSNCFYSYTMGTTDYLFGPLVG
jgi:hypothetical protein